VEFENTKKEESNEGDIGKQRKPRGEDPNLLADKIMKGFKP
jgi:hypothetical protein